MIGMTKKQGKQASQKEAPTGRKVRKRNLPQSGEEHSQSRKMPNPKRAAACKDFKEKSSYF